MKMFHSTRDVISQDMEMLSALAFGELYTDTRGQCLQFGLNEQEPYNNAPISTRV